MLKQYFALLLTLTFTSIKAQNNLIILTEKGSKFFLSVNEQAVNDSAQSQVKKAKVFDDTCSVKLVFTDGSPEFKGTVFLTEAGKTVNNREFTYSLSEGKGKRELKFISMNLARVDTISKPQSPEKKIEAIFTEKEKKQIELDKLAEKYPPPGNCPVVISDSLLQANLKLLKDNHIDMNRQKDAKWFISHNCIDTKQLIKVMETFDRDDSRVKIAKFSFDYIQDHRNFMEVVDAVKFSTEKEELKKFFDKRIEK